MSDFLNQHSQRQWANDLESYKRYTSMMRGGSATIKSLCLKNRNRIRSYWPTQQKAFDAIDREVLAP